MQTRCIITGLMAILLAACSVPQYLPTADKIDVNPYGSYIVVNSISGRVTDGELIAFERNNFVVLTTSLRDSAKKSVIIPTNEVKSFTLQYAQPKHYGWTIPLYTVACISHGWFLIFSVPINLIVTISVTVAGENAYEYKFRDLTSDKNGKVINSEQVKMFARFPYGIPTGIDLASIK